MTLLPDAVPCPGRRSASVEVVVVGGGVIGAAAAWQLARRGHDVVVLEKAELCHPRVSPHGAARVFRQGYTSPLHVQLAAESLRRWRQLEQETGAALLTLTGGIDHGDQNATTAIARTLAGQGIRHEWLDPAEASARWPGMQFDGPVLHQPDSAGRLRADQAVAALTAAAMGRGATVRYSTPVEHIEIVGTDLAEVHTPGGSIRTRRVVLAAGAWTAGLVGHLVPLPPLQVTEEQPAVFPLVGGTPSVPTDLRWPTFIHHTGPDDGWPGGVYGVGVPCEGVKVGFGGAGSQWDPERTDSAPEPTQLSRLQEYVEAFLPGLDVGAPTPFRCAFVSTPDAEFLVERNGPLVVAAGFSGHGFKFATALGRMVCDLAGDSDPELRLAPASSL